MKKSAKSFISALGLSALAIFPAFAGENLNGIFLGEDVASVGSATPRVAIHIGTDGVVTVFVGSLVPGLKDAQGNEVHVKSVKTQVIKAEELKPPRTASLTEAVAKASKLWNVSAPVRAVRYGPLGDGCANATGAIPQVALTDFATRTITVNSWCHWDRGAVSDDFLTQVLEHEIGHILMGPEHSDDPHSVMYPSIGDLSQKITPDDRKRLKESMRMEISER